MAIRNPSRTLSFLEAFDKLGSVRYRNVMRGSLFESGLFAERAFQDRSFTQLGSDALLGKPSTQRSLHDRFGRSGKWIGKLIACIRSPIHIHLNVMLLQITLLS